MATYNPDARGKPGSKPCFRRSRKPKTGIARRRHDYKEFPRQIFGLTCPQHRAFKIRHVLVYYNKQFSRKATKVVLLRLLFILEGEVNDVENAAIDNWLRRHSSTEAQFTTLLNAIRGVGRPAVVPGVIVVSAPPSTPQHECCVCLEALPAESFPKQKITPLCNHEPKVCQNCLTQSINTQVPDVAWDQVQCPECPETLPYDVVKRWASPQTFERYDRNSLLAAFREIPNFVMCLAPGCNSGQIHEGGDDQPIMTCNTCHFKTCFIHQRPWHSSQTCAEYEAMEAERKLKVEQEAASAKLIAETAKKCPNPRCGHGITKTGGCDHMTCRRCSYGFCYVCLAPWKMIMRHGNTAHAPTCKYHTTML